MKGCDNFQFISCVVKEETCKQLKAASIRSIWFELAQSLAICDISFLLSGKLRWLLDKNRGRPGYEYDPETNRYDAVSSNE